MNIALASFQITKNFEQNQDRMLLLSRQAVRDGAELIVFPEASATGLVNSGNPEEDFKIAESVPGPRNNQWRDFALENNVFFSAGLFESCSEKIYDSGVVFGPDGKLILHYRRNHPGWRFTGDDPGVYSTGCRIPTADIKLDGRRIRLGLLICGDLWDDEIVARIASKRPDILIYPFARSVSEKNDLEVFWNKEFSGYRQRMADIGAVTLAVNALNVEDGYPGGGWVINTKGNILATLPMYQDDYTVYEIKLP